MIRLITKDPAFAIFFFCGCKLVTWQSWSISRGCRHPSGLSVEPGALSREPPGPASGAQSVLLLWERPAPIRRPQKHPII